jgi:hypothetical protein
MKRELSVLMRSAGYRVIWGDPTHPDKLGLVTNLIVLKLSGTCGMPPGSYRVERAVASGVSLAETSVSSGNVMPFSLVHCANLTRMVGPSLALEAGAQRDFLYGRAMARVVAHEFYHVLAGSQDHGHEGVSKSHFSVADLLNENFDFDAATLNKLRQKSDPASALTETALAR